MILEVIKTCPNIYFRIGCITSKIIVLLKISEVFFVTGYENIFVMKSNGEEIVALVQKHLSSNNKKVGTIM